MNEQAHSVGQPGHTNINALPGRLTTAGLLPSTGTPRTLATDPASLAKLNNTLVTNETAIASLVLNATIPAWYETTVLSPKTPRKFQQYLSNFVQGILDYSQQHPWNPLLPGIYKKKISQLIKKGAAINYQYEHGNTALHRTIQHNDENALGYCLRLEQILLSRTTREKRHAS